MSRNGDGSLEDEDRLSLCSSCRSELRSIYSLGVPSSLDESSPVSGAPSVSQDRAVAEDDNGRKSMQSGTASASRDERDPKPPSKHGDDLAGAMTGRTSADGRNAPTRVTLLTAYEAQKLRNVTYERVYRFVNLRRGRAEMVGRGSRSARQEEEEEPKLPGVVGRSCVDLRADDDAREPAERVESAIDARSMERRDGIRDPSSAPTSTSNVKKVEASKMPVGPESAGSDLGNRRRNLYKLAVRVSELSAYIRDTHQVLLKRGRTNGAKAKHKGSAKAQASSESKGNVESSAESESAQDSLMYSYNPLRMGGGVSQR